MTHAATHTTTHAATHSTTHAAAHTTTATAGTTTSSIITRNQSLNIFLDWLNFLSNNSHWTDDFSNFLDDWFINGLNQSMWGIF